MMPNPTARNVAAAAVCGLLILGATAARGDSFFVGRLRYPDINIVDVRDAVLYYRIGGRSTTKPLSEIDAFELTGQDNFNRAERQMAPQGGGDPDPAEAARLYALAEATARRGWLPKLIAYRRLEALRRTDAVDKAVEQWLEVMELKDAGGNALEAVPDRLAAKGSEANARAIRLLEAKRRELADGTLKDKLTDLLLSLYEKQGRMQDAARLAGQITGGDGGPKAGADTAAQEMRVRALSVQVEGAVRNRDERKLRQLGDTLQAEIRSLDRSSLAEALYQLGRAQWYGEQIADGAPDPAVLRKAGLNFMRVATHFPRDEHAAESLYLAGKINESLGNRTAAGAVYRLLQETYPQSPFAARAEEAIEALNQP